MLPQSERAATKVARTLASLRGDVHEMTASTINHTLDRLDKASGALTDVFIAEGRGYERPSETFELRDPLALLYVQLHDARTVLRNEVARRYGPGAPSRLPTRR